MSQDPYASDSSKSQNPDGGTSPNLYRTPPQSPPSTQNQHQVPPQTYYGEYPQPQNPYGAPLQNPYGIPPQGTYGAPGYNPNQNNYDYYASSAPLPLKQALSQLPNQYIKVLTKPSSFTFATEMGKASWNILWVQLVGYVIIASIMNYLHRLLFPVVSVATNSNFAFIQLENVFSLFTISSPFTFIITFPIMLFIGQGITYLFAKAFSGSGTFLRQIYSYLLILVPIGIISSALNFIPILGPVIAFGLGVYVIVLQIFSLMAVHRLSGGKATAVVLIPLMILYVLAFILVIFVVIALTSSIHPTWH